MSRSNAANANLEQKYHNLETQLSQLSVENARLLEENTKLAEANGKLASENGASKEQAKEAHALLAQMKAELVTATQGKMKTEIELGQLRRELTNLKRSLA